MKDRSCNTCHRANDECKVCTGWLPPQPLPISQVEINRLLREKIADLEARVADLEDENMGVEK